VCEVDGSNGGKGLRALSRVRFDIFAESADVSCRFLGRIMLEVVEC
jgi:hypothetical protein